MMTHLRWKSHMKMLAALVLAAVMALPAATTAMAAGRLEVDREGALRLEYIYNGQPLAGAGVRLYRTADITEVGAYELSGDFKDLPVNLENLDSAGWKAAAGTLEFYTATRQMTPLKTGTVDPQGAVDFGTLRTGLYLIVIDELTLNGNNYYSAPFLISLPSLDEDDVWYYDIGVRPKSTESEPEHPYDTTLTVIKVWNDGRHSNRRPQEITVTLFMDDEEYDTVTLSEAVQWRKVWTDLGGEHTWRVVETGVPYPYTVTYTKEGAVYYITNTYHTNNPGGGGGDDGGGGGSTPPPVTETINDPDTPLGNTNPPVDEIPEDPVPLVRLPQTGLLWWPVPFLAMGGLLLVGLGYKDYCNGKRKKDEQ